MKKFWVLLIALVFPFILSGNDNLLLTKLKYTHRQENQIVKRSLDVVDVDSDEFEEARGILEESFETSKEQFPSYLDITALNVQDKEQVTLPGFDIDYVAPEFYDILHDYQNKMLLSFSNSELIKFERFRKTDYYFDRYTTLNEIKYSNLDPTLKYIHTIKPVNPLVPITPLYPGTNPGNEGTISLQPISEASSILEILQSGGILENVIVAFSACLSVLSKGLATSLIPIIGKALAIAIVVSALLGIAIMIVKYWDQFKVIMPQIILWMVSSYYPFKDLINLYMEDVKVKGEKSKVAHRETVNGKVKEFIDTEVTPEVISKIVDDCYRNKTVYLLGHIEDVEQGQNWWICFDTETPDIVIKEKVYDRGICTYTWYNDTAKKMMAEGSCLNGDYSLLIYERSDDGTDTVPGHHSMIGFSHYHLGKRVIKDGTTVVDKYDNKKPKEKLKAWAHSLFGRLSYRDKGGTKYTYYPF